jgi:hypothetical protein
MIFMIIAAHVILLLSGLIDSRLGYTSSLITTQLIKQLFHACISAATVYTAQYWLSMRIKNLTLPVAMGAALIILPIAVLIIIGIAGLVSNPATFQNIITWNPYSYPFASAFQFVNSLSSGNFPLQTWIFLAISVMFLVWGTYDFAKRKIT